MSVRVLLGFMIVALLPGSVVAEWSTGAPHGMALAMQNPQNIPPAGASRGYYTPTAPPSGQGQQRPCGHYGNPPCDAQVSVPPGASGEQLYGLAAQAEQRRQPAQAMAYLKKSAELGYVRAQAALGQNYVNGKGVPRDYEQAVYWLDLASRQGSRGAESSLADLLESGEGGVQPDQPRAIALLKASAAQHYGPAEMSLGLDYEYGRGVPHNRAMSISLLRRAAADSGELYAQAYADALSRAPAAAFRNEQELAAFVHPPPSRQGGGSCPAFAVYSTGPAMQARINNFCSQNPGCPYSSPGFGSMRCPR